jgi:hypothetical protein
MKPRTIGLGLLLSIAAAGTCFAGNPTLGTWKLDETKSHFGEGVGKATTVTWQKAGDQDKCTVDGVDAAGKKTHTVWTGKLDGKDYPVTGDRLSDSRAFKQTGDNTIEMISKKDGKVVGDGKVVVAADGKTRTVTSTIRNAKGVKVTSTQFYDKS